MIWGKIEPNLDWLGVNRRAGLGQSQNTALMHSTLAASLGATAETAAACEFQTSLTDDMKIVWEKIPSLTQQPMPTMGCSFGRVLKFFSLVVCGAV